MTIPSSLQPPSIVYWLQNNLYLNITNHCTNNCYFCLRRFKGGVSRFNLKLKTEPSPNEIVKALQANINTRTCKEIVFCGFGEPTTRLHSLLQVANWISRNTSKPIRLNTNGQALLLYPDREVVKELKDNGISKISVSLNASDESTYKHVCQPRFSNAFEKIVEFTEHTRSAGFDVEITAVTLPEVKISTIQKLANKLKVKFRARLYQPCIW